MLRDDPQKHHFLNLTRGLSWLPFLPENEPYSFLRLQSTWCGN